MRAENRRLFLIPIEGDRERKLRGASTRRRLCDRTDTGAGTNLSFFMRTAGAVSKILHLDPDSWQSVIITLWENEGCRRFGNLGTEGHPCHEPLPSSTSQDPRDRSPGSGWRGMRNPGRRPEPAWMNSVD
jgi:hypothetical protein